MASNPPDTTNHGHWQPAQDSQMSRGNQSEPTTPNSPRPGFSRLQTNGPPSSRSWSGFERSGSFEALSSHERYQPGSGRAMGYGKATPPLSGNSLSRGPSLPPLRELVPEFDQLRDAPRDPRPSLPSATSSPRGDVVITSAFTGPEYTHSPIQTKRRRVSYGDGGEQRDSQVPRSYSNFSMSRREPSWDGSQADGRARWSPTNLPGLSTGKGVQETRPGSFASQRSPGGPWGEAGGGVMLPRMSDLGDHRGRSPLDLVPGDPYLSGYIYGSQQGPPPPLTAPQGYDRRPLSHGSYGSYRDDGFDRKPRKRRGNLPKETTDFLFNWLQNHTSHAYPSEEEKQWMMRETGLQLNQVSNWFINARRRKLPTMMANAKVEADVMGWTESPRSGHERALSLDADNRDAHASSRQRSLKRGYETMNRESV